MNCTQCQIEFDRLLDKRVDDVTAGLVRQHLAACPGCASEWRDHEAAWIAFSAVPEIEPSSNFVACVMGRLDRAESEMPVRAWFFPAWWRWAAPVMATAVLLVAGTGWWMNFQRDGEQAVSHELVAELPVVQHLELLKDFDIIANLDQIAPLPEHDPVEEMLNALWNS